MIKSIFSILIISLLPLSQFPVNLCKKNNYYWWYYFVIFICFQWYCHVQLQFLAQFKVELFLFPYDPATPQHPIKTMKLCFSDVDKKKRLRLAKLRLIDSRWIANVNYYILHAMHKKPKPFDSTLLTWLFKASISRIHTLIDHVIADNYSNSYCHITTTSTTFLPPFLLFTIASHT